MSLSEQFKRFRKEFGLTQKAVAEKIGIAQPAYSQYEFNIQGKTKIPRADVIIKLAKAYNVSADYLLGLSDDPTPPNKRTQEVKQAEKQAEKPSNETEELVALRLELERIKSVLADSGIKV